MFFQAIAKRSAHKPAFFNIRKKPASRFFGTHIFHSNHARLRQHIDFGAGFFQQPGKNFTRVCTQHRRR